MNSTGNIEKARPIGRLLRLLFGALVLFSVVPYYFIVPTDAVIQTILAVFGLVVFYVLFDLVINKLFPTIHPVMGAFLANTSILLMWLLGRDVIQLGALSYLGASLVITGLRADKGCEVMSIPGLIFGRRTHLDCFFFSPVDWLEKKIAR
jgi:hypothetical protein